jgi:zinc transporter
MSVDANGSDGLIHAVRGDGTQVTTLTWEELDSWQPADGLLWVHCDARSERVNRWLNAEGRLPPTVAHALLADETRPRVALVEAGVLLNLRGVNENPGAEPEDMVSLRIWAEQHRVITVRQRRMIARREVLASLERDPATNSGDLLVRIAGFLIGRMSDVVENIDDRLANLEERVLEDPDKSIRIELAGVRREVIALRRYLAPQREALGRLYGERIAWFSDLDRLRLREVSDRLIRYIEDLDAARERAAVIQEELATRLSEQLNERMYVLAIVAALFLPLGFLAGLLGVNLGGIPGSANPIAFTAFTLGLLGVGGLVYFFFVRKGWF